MSNSAEVMNVLKECDKVNRELLSESQDYEKIFDHHKNNREDAHERNNLFSNYLDEVADDDIDQELEVMMDLTNQGKDITQMSNFKNTESKKESNLNSEVKYTVNIDDFPSTKKDNISLDELINEFKK